MSSFLKSGYLIHGNDVRLMLLLNTTQYIVNERDVHLKTVFIS